MAEETNEFTHIGVKKGTQRKVALLAKVANGGMNIYDLVDAWANDAWEEARQAGVVTDAMLNPPAHWVHPIVATETPRQPLRTRKPRSVKVRGREN